MKDDAELVNDYYKRLCVEEIENKIGYEFKERSFLLQAFTHSSYSDNILTDSYERLEYLGDAVLDYLVTCYIYKHTKATPGSLTDIRSALVCNNMFASLVVDMGLHGYILYLAPQIKNRISDYVTYREEDRACENKEANRQRRRDRSDSNHSNETASNEQLVLGQLNRINETETPVLTEVEVPKVLGDVFEALMGAVFIDSGHSLDTVWRVYQRFKPNLEKICRQPPRNPKTKLHEKFPDSCQFSGANVKENCVQVAVTVKLNGVLRSFHGRGHNKKSAQMAAAKCALRKIRN